MVAVVQRKRLTLHSNQPSEEVLSAEVYLAEKWHEHTKPIITQYGLKGLFMQGTNLLSYYWYNVVLL